jgi:hypothetical protein
LDSADDQVSFEAQLLLPIKTLAYGVPPHTFVDYFQMFKGYARYCCRQLVLQSRKVYATQYLRLPTVDDVTSILLEALVDYHMFFWHASYGYAGKIGDLNVLNMSPLLERMVDGTS